VVDYQVANRAGSLTFIGTDYFNGWPIYVTDRDLSKHGVAVGTTGAGKTEYAFAEKQQRKFYLFNADNVAERCLQGAERVSGTAGGSFAVDGP
jgi:hypothetical protein